jgi:hypothetical protein
LYYFNVCCRSRGRDLNLMLKLLPDYMKYNKNRIKYDFLVYLVEKSYFGRFTRDSFKTLINTLLSNQLQNDFGV